MNPLLNVRKAPVLLLFCCLALLAAAAMDRRRAAAAPDPSAKPATAAKDGSDNADAADVTNPMGANAACYVCHIPFVREEISKVHLAAKVGCIECHGLSADHANDEDIGATKPDIMFKRDGIDKMCGKCHEEHDAPARQVVARFIERKLSTARPAVCTDCHGTHKIERAAEEEAEEKSGG